MLIGYARVSSQDQNLTLQHNALTEIGCHKIYDDKTTRMLKNYLSKSLTKSMKKSLKIILILTQQNMMSLTHRILANHL